jgi:FdrA protein
VGIVGASGTGIQQLCCLLDAARVGVRHALGTGSRDLSADVGAISTLQGLAALDADPAVNVVVVVSKPPDPFVAAEVAMAVADCATPVVEVLLGRPEVTLERAASAVLAELGRPRVEFPLWSPAEALTPRPGRLRGCFVGGTLCAEARLTAADRLGPVATDPAAPGHACVDYGDDAYTRGRAHPMIDPALRLAAIADAAADPETAVVLADVVLGYGSHPDPAAELAPIVDTAVGGGVPVVISLCGSSRDPQGRDRQAAMLATAGAEVFLSNAAAARRAVELVDGDDR